MTNVKLFMSRLTFLGREVTRFPSWEYLYVPQSLTDHDMTVFDLTALLLTGVVLLLSLLLWLYPRRSSRLPPGPGFALPLLGHLHLMGKDPRATFRKWRRQYGDIFSLYMGRQLTVVLNGHKVIKEALVKQAHAFSDRPVFPLNDLVSEKKGIVLASGAEWKTVRKACLEILRDFGMGTNLLAQKIQEEVTEYIRTIASKNGKPFDVTRLTQISVSNNICSILFGKRFDYDDQEFKDFMKAIDTVVANQDSSVGALFPFVRHIPGDPFKARKTICDYRVLLDTFIQPIVTRHIQELDGGPNSPDDFITAYLRRVRQDEADQKVSYITETGLPLVIFQLFGAGSETTATTLRWAVVYFLYHPGVQEKCHQEIMEVIGVDRSPTMQDRPEMTYLEATTTEILRIANIAPLNIPHATPCDVRISGWTIPKGTMVIPNLDSVLYDPVVWGDPDTFRPERFIGPDGKLIRYEEFIPFSTGRRACLGESLARMELFLYLAAMIQHFRFLPPEDGQMPSLEGILGVICSPKPFTFRAVPRL
ncbi:hypothetical protein BaRGS_00035504 [Batillaria attramentaria]|uniref:Cytochrome P450 n=1 Tax=Batillaria attramentaria TaxID=370345 RepID=A0ABD0JDV2_9CAEN